jgi:AraC-like DNA-binding protein
MKIETILPNPLLSKYIDFYYFIKESSPLFRSVHFSFPHSSNVVSIYKNATLRSETGTVKIFHDRGSNYLTTLQKKHQMPLKVELNGLTDRVSIFFKPLGLNAFINSPLYLLMSRIEFLDWEMDPLYNEMLKSFFNIDDLQERINILERFLVGIVKDIENPMLEKSISILTDCNNEYLMEDVCGYVGLPIRTFTRQFRDAIGVSPIAYRRIARFRHSLENKLINEQFKKLTEIAYSSNFYDQSYFNKIYRQMTGSKPKAFFDEVSKLANDKLIFKFINK